MHDKSYIYIEKFMLSYPSYKYSLWYSGGKEMFI